MSSPLNYDIWLHIANLSNEYDLPRLVQVCRNLYDFITPEIYTSVTGLRTPYAVISFCKSALSNPPQRSHRLSNLAIDFDDFIDDPASCAVLAINLASLLRQAAQLESLSISCVEELLCAEPQLAKALAEAPKLRQLYLQGKHPQVGTLACRTVERMQNLRVITLDFRIEREEGVWRAGFFQRSTPLPRLAVVLLPFKTSLRVLNIKGSGPPPLSKWSVRFQRSWTALRELTITSMRTADAPFLAEAFPNLRYLYATTSTPLINVTTTPGTGTTWSSGTLDTFEGNYSCFVFIPLWCPIRRLDLATQETHGLRQHSLHDAYLLYVLEKSCPSVVSIRVKLGRPKEFYIELSRRLSNVRYLRLVLDEGSGVEGSLDFLNFFPEVFGCLPIRYLSLEFQPYPENGYTSAEVDATLRRNFLRRLAENVVPFGFVELCWEMAGWERSCWVIQTGTGQNVRVRLNESQGIAARDLWLASR